MKDKNAPGSGGCHWGQEALQSAVKESLQRAMPVVNIPSPFSKARVVKWQTRTFEGRMP